MKPSETGILVLPKDRGVDDRTMAIFQEVYEKVAKPSETGILVLPKDRGVDDRTMAVFQAVYKKATKPCCLFA